MAFNEDTQHWTAMNLWMQKEKLFQSPRHNLVAQFEFYVDEYVWTEPVVRG
jgi:hypothetical protein